MEGIYVFWYCNCHDDGALIYHSLENYNMEGNFMGNILYFPPEWLNICYDSNKDKDKELYCNYTSKGIIEYKDAKVSILAPIQYSYEREGGGFKFEYYLENILQYICDVQNHILLEESPLLNWFNEKIKKNT